MVTAEPKLRPIEVVGHTLREEFRAYNLPDFFYYIIGALKITAALLAWDFLKTCRDWCTLAAALMVTFAMHLKIRDPLIKAVPSVIALTLFSTLLLK